jgi:crotonobetainyl-CoA:carnitine CoA-transferase CaiB-like acyl-CoA transferase
MPEASLRAGSDVPRYAPINLADRATGLYAFGIICAALYARERTGVGQAVDIPMFETMAQMVLGDHLYGHTYLPSRGDFGYPRLLNPERRPYQTKDGFACILVYTEEQWAAFLGVTGDSRLFTDDPRFKDSESRTANIHDLYLFVAAKFLTKSTAEWKSLLEPLGIPVFPVHTFESLLADPHLADIGYFQEYEHPTEGRLRTMAVPSEWSESKLPPLRPPPLLGEHSRQLLAECGYSDDEIDELIRAGTTQVPGDKPGWE